MERSSAARIDFARGDESIRAALERSISTLTPIRSKAEPARDFFSRMASARVKMERESPGKVALGGVLLSRRSENP